MRYYATNYRRMRWDVLIIREITKGRKFFFGKPYSKGYFTDLGSIV
jgi:hypothetical protein